MRTYPFGKAMTICSLTPSGSNMNVTVLWISALRTFFSLFAHLLTAQICSCVVFTFCFFLILFFQIIRALPRQILVNFPFSILVQITKQLWSLGHCIEGKQNHQYPNWYKLNIAQFTLFGLNAELDSGTRFLLFPLGEDPKAPSSEIWWSSWDWAPIVEVLSVPPSLFGL